MKFNKSEFNKAKRVLAARDPSLKRLLARHKLSFEPQMQRSPYESLVRAIAHQQLHGKAAETILGRMLDLFPKEKFPAPESILKLSPVKLRSCGFSNSKVKSIRDIAQKTLDGLVPTSKEIHKLTNDEIISRLTEIYGVGRWTVEMLLIFQLGRLDVWPVDDFGVRKGFVVWKKKRDLLKPKDLARFSKDFAPYQSVVALYLWREADAK